MDGNTRLNEITELSSQLMTATEALLPFERTATLQLRAVVHAVQLDTQLMSGLLTNLDERKDSFCTTSDDCLDASQELISTLSTILSAEKLGSITENLRTTNKKQHRPFVDSVKALCLDLEAARRKFDAALKAYWLPRYLSIQRFENYQDSPISDAPEQLLKLLTAFRQHPFAIGSSNDPFIESAPDNRDEVLPFQVYQTTVGDLGLSWARAYSKEQWTLETFAAAQNAAVTLLWGGGVQTIADIDTVAFNQPEVDFSELAQARVQLNNRLRDSILRHQVPLFSIVFVGAESSGKSTFLNAFIGIELLPTGAGPTTSYPVRIHHSSGQATPVMTLGVATLKGSIDKLRTGEWANRIQILLDDVKKNLWGTKAKWRGKDLPIGFDFERFKKRWASLDSSMAVKLRELTREGSEFAEAVLAVKDEKILRVEGAGNILRTLEKINDLVRICRNLPIGFDHFAPEEWPTISLEFPNLRGLYGGGILEIVDIPVEYFSDVFELRLLALNRVSVAPYQWDEMLQETLRAAKLIIAVVSLREFDSDVWKELPQFIASGTNVRASGVIVTMRDYAPLMAAELATRLDIIKSVFWPYFDETGREGSILVCSTTVGTTMLGMKRYLADLKERPDWDTLWDPVLEPASRRLFPGKLEHVYAKHTLETLRASTEKLFQSSGLPGAIKAIIAMVEMAENQSLLAECKGIISQSKRVAFDLRRMLAAVGKALGDVETPISESNRRASDNAMEILDNWASRTGNFTRDVRLLVESTSHDIVSEVDKCVVDTMLRAWNELKEHSRRLSSLPESFNFQHMDDVNYYMQLYGDRMGDALNATERLKSQRVLEEIHQMHELSFSRLRDQINQIAPSTADDWPSPQGGLPSSSLPLVSKKGYSDTIEEQRATYSPMLAFESMERRILGLISNTEDAEARLKNLRTGFRWLLALASTLPFILTLPYWLQKSHVESYRLNVQKLRGCLLDLAKAHSSDILGQIGEEATVLGQLELELVANTMSSSFSIPEGYSTQDALPSVTPAQLQKVTAGLANLVAFNAVIDWIRESVEKLG